MKAYPGSRSWIAGVVLAAGALPAPAAAECRMIQLATLPVTANGSMLTIPGKVNDHEITILGDTGAEESVLWGEVAEQAGVRLKEEPGWKMVGYSGEAKMYRGKVEDLQISDFHVRGRSWPAVGGSALGDGLGMILGADFWSKVDFEVDLAQSRIILWDTEGCAKSSLAYWSQTFMLAELKDDSGDLVRTDVMINGIRVRATIDTGSSSTMINSSLARRIGFRSDDEGTAGQVHGLGSRGGVESFVAIFDTFQLGDLSIKNARMLAFDMDRHTKDFRSTRFGDSGPELSDLLIGMDFLRANRVLVSNSQGLLYMTYNGGKVFQTEPPAELQDPAGGVSLDGYAHAIDLPPAAEDAFRTAGTARTAGRHDEAEGLYRQALEQLGPDLNGPAKVLVLSQLAGTLEEQQKLSEAEAAYLQLVPAAQQALGAEDPLVAVFLTRLGTVYDLQNKRTEATAAFQWALAVIDKNAAADSGRTAAMLTQLGMKLSESQRYAEAEAVFLRAQALWEKTSGAYDVDAAAALLNVASAVEAQGRTDEAEGLYKRAEKILRKKLGPEHELTRFSEEALARLRASRAD